MLKNIELFDKLSLRFNGRVLFIKDVIGDEICCWSFYGQGRKIAEVCCTSIVYATEKKQTKVRALLTGNSKEGCVAGQRNGGTSYRHRASREGRAPSCLRAIWPDSGLHLCAQLPGPSPSGILDLSDRPCSQMAGTPPAWPHRGSLVKGLCCLPKLTLDYPWLSTLSFPSADPDLSSADVGPTCHGFLKLLLVGVCICRWLMHVSAGALDSLEL